MQVAAGNTLGASVAHHKINVSGFGVIICRLHREPGKIINAVDLEVVIENSVFRTEEQFVRE